MMPFDVQVFRRVRGHRLTAMVFGAAVIGASVALSAPAGPTTRAASTSTTAPATRSIVPATGTAASAPVPSPKAVAIAFAGMIARGDAAAAKGLVPDDPSHQRWVDATC